MKTVAIIPARGGSKGIPRKNIRYLNGKPLIAYSIQVLLDSQLVDKVIVSTDDEEIANISKGYGAEVIMRPEYLASDEVPLDPVIYDVVQHLERQHEYYDIVLTVQPTSPLLKLKTLNGVIEKLINSNYETVITAKDDRHLSWEELNGMFFPKYSERKNRQYLPPEFRETGAILASKRDIITENSRIGKNVTLYTVSEFESVDIDSPMDWWVAEKLLNRKKIVLRVDGYKEIGLGHIFRTLSIANNIIDHEVVFLMCEKHDLGIRLVKEQNFNVVTFIDNPVDEIIRLGPDIVINDILDTSKDYIQSLKNLGIKVFNFEDLGDGAEYADGVFNALYPGDVPFENFYTGEKYYISRNEFVNTNIKEIKKEVKNILITFGGTDPNNLTLKTLKSICNLNENFDITIILGPGYLHFDELNEEVKKIKRRINIYKTVKNMADHMYNSDIIFSSAGRTMYEIAMIGTPSIIIAQNYREVTHLFGHNYNGFINLGIHSEVNDERIKSVLIRLISDFDLRRNMHKRMLKHDLKHGLKRIFSIIFAREEE
ncbi:UDP-2,4-diacetamido-2,4,6-trideoxy-beta-L-altropyranose hydrolase [Bacillus salipaludis]|uniref:UDP-2,4-diacetamido-2,4, 6-trideoxy-beta-L-altropyranose hydrolase n=1 Tax=Bacillus salipaludis TaxID=2547811 RepID=A0A4R5VXN8_9BACI|nr:glycosyltransferase [Bacillus salipaludis]TDK64134.1 UDP-2,4-diacetamido-2,4,6-trideoxy-beta-L-altropyranose hydrolase [Bacillus salipaludis]